MLLFPLISFPMFVLYSLQTLLLGRFWLFLIIALIVLVILGLIIGTRPYKLNSEIRPNPVSSYEEALSRVEQILAEESQLLQLNPMCGTRLMTHKGKAEKVIVFLHGFTSCPDQFAQLGKEFFRRGCNVYIPRLPRHGQRDRLGNPLKGLTAEDLALFATQSADIAQGLGQRVIIVGLSGGGSMTTWLSQERDDVDLAVPISPFLGIGFIPRMLNRPLVNIILRIPDFFQWWDPVNKENNPNSAPYSYTRYPIHALFENLRLGYVAESKARLKRPAAGSILIITNANDRSVNNSVIGEFKDTWQFFGKEFVQSFEFAKDLQLPHDLITVGRPDAKTELVYPKLHELIH